jgi:alkylation response protein AidB-like acyl-CoA dehydrogenase
MIYLVEDNEALRNGLMAMLKEFAQLEVSGASGTEQEATEWLHRHSADWRLAVVDLFLLQGSGFEYRQLAVLAQAMGAEGLRDHHPFGRHLVGARVASFTDGSSEMLLERIAAGLRKQATGR